MTTGTHGTHNSKPSCTLLTRGGLGRKSLGHSCWQKRRNLRDINPACITARHGKLASIREHCLGKYSTLLQRGGSGVQMVNFVVYTVPVTEKQGAFRFRDRCWSQKTRQLSSFWMPIGLWSKPRKGPCWDKFISSTTCVPSMKW